jgi:hypothetical protein
MFPFCNYTGHVANNLSVEQQRDLSFTGGQTAIPQAMSSVKLMGKLCDSKLPSWKSRKGKMRVGR